MELDQPPSPVQPRALTSAAHDMARGQQWPSMFEASYLGRVHHHSSQKLSMPATQTGYYQYATSFEKHKSAHFKLPPIRTSMTTSSTESNRHDKPLAIADLLSSRPSPPDGKQTEIDSATKDLPQSDYELKTRPPHCNLFSHNFTSLTDARASITPCPPASPYNSNSRQHQKYGNMQAQANRTCSSRSDRDHFQQSPVSAVPSNSPSYYSGSSEPLSRSRDAAIYTQTPPPIFSKTPPFNYNLSIRQQPIAGRACGFGERDRRVIDPPPILELKIANKVTEAPEQDSNAMLALHCTLSNADDNNHQNQIDTTYADVPPARRLMGTLVASPYPAKDEHGIAGTFFVFSDLSCRIPGKFKLQFKLLRVDPMLMQPGAVHGSVASTESDVFSVYTAKDFPGMRASTALLTTLRCQGLNVGLKKGTEKRISKFRKRKESESSEDEESLSGNEGRRSNESGKMRVV